MSYNPNDALIPGMCTINGFADVALITGDGVFTPAIASASAGDFSVSTWHLVHTRGGVYNVTVSLENQSLDNDVQIQLPADPNGNTPNVTLKGGQGDVWYTASCIYVVNDGGTVAFGVFNPGTAPTTGAVAMKGVVTRIADLPTLV